ncbi:MAG TPA: efflux RND transporter periplasmic adaptor subunit [Nitrospira sp.]|nr:efflux RND transporter periplasmic adaptor subunit [Nitrospira sp.]
MAGDPLKGRTVRSIDHPTVVTVVTFAVAVCLTGCGNNPQDSSSANPPSVRGPSGLLRLTTEELSRTSIEVVAVGRGQIRQSREFPATIQPNENELAEVTTLIRGRVVKVQVDVGADVKKGDLLALLHSTDLGLSEGAYLKATARLYEADLAYQRAKDLYEHHAVSLAELQRRDAEMRTARAEMHETQNRLELLGVPRQEIERLDREHTIKADVSLRAPFDGRVIMRNITRGEVVETNQRFFTVADLSNVWVIASVPEKDVEYIHKDQTVEMVAAAYPHAVFSGTITYVGDVLDPATRTLRVRITAPNPDKRLKPEMFALVRVYAAPNPEMLTIPLSAVQNGPAGKMVFVQRAPTEFEVRTVRLGNEYGDDVAVIDGVRSGESVVTKGSFTLKSEMERHKIEPAS